MDTKPKNLRPISLLSTVGKVLEKIICVRLKWHAELSEWINDEQFGFQERLGSESALLKFTNYAKAGFKQRQETLTLSLDISQAFQHLWHGKLMSVLKKNNCSMQYLVWLSSYLQERSVEVDTGSQKHSRVLSMSCPQGATLSPFLWNIYINTLIERIKQNGGEVIAFADDVTISLQSHSRRRLSNKMMTLIRVVEEFGKEFKLDFNPRKKNAVLFSCCRKNTAVHLSMAGEELELKQDMKILGVILDRKLTWSSHINYICAKASKVTLALNASAKSKWGISSEILRHLYLAAVEPIILYGCLVWGEAVFSISKRCKFQRVQRIAALGILGALKTSPTSGLLVLAGLLPIHLVIRQRMCMTYLRSTSDPVINKVVHLTESLRAHEQSSTYFSSIQFADQDIRISQLDRDSLLPLANKNSTHPALRVSPNVTLLDREGAIKLEQEIRGIPGSNIYYTDASKFGNDLSMIGYAVVKLKEDGLNYKLENNGLMEAGYSVFDGELMAIEKSIDHISLDDDCNKSYIFSDSLSCVQALLYGEKTKSISIRRVRKKLEAIKDKNVTLVWIPAHINIPGNEIADFYAKSVLLDDDPAYEIVEFSPNLKFCKKYLACFFSRKWNDLWLDDLNARFLHNEIGIKSVCSKNIHPIIKDQQNYFDRKIIARTALNHFPTNSYLHRFKLRADDKCRFCNYSPESLSHLLLNCPRFSPFRYQVIALVEKPLTIKNCFKYYDKLILHVGKNLLK